MISKQAAVYILASRHNGTSYTGVTNNLPALGWQHGNDMIEGFTKKYGVHTLVYVERHDEMVSAIRREKRTAIWQRSWKIELMKKQNPMRRDLYAELSSRPRSRRPSLRRKPE